MLIGVIIILILAIILVWITLNYLIEKELIKENKYIKYLKIKKEKETLEYTFKVFRFLVLIAGVIIFGGSLGSVLIERDALPGILTGIGLILVAIYTNKLLNLD